MPDQSAHLWLVWGMFATPFIGAAIVGFSTIWIKTGRAQAVIAICAAGVSGALTLALWFTLPRPFVVMVPWVQSLGIYAGFHIDDLTFLFALLVAGISLLSLIYSFWYVPHEVGPQKGSSEGGYYAYMLLFTGAMLGMVMAADLVQLFVFWELTGIASFLLIGLHQAQQVSREGAVRSLLVTGSGGVVMLAGFIILGYLAGDFSLEAALESSGVVQSSSLLPLALLPILIGAATKSAQFPFHVWLPTAMVAPTPVSAFLHSASLVAAGVYLLARLHPVFAATSLWQIMVTSIGLSAAIAGGFGALKTNRIKGILAYSTISQYGFMFALLGYGTGGALAAALFSFFQHGVTKAALFFTAGAVTYSTHMTEIGRSGGLWRRMPITFGVAAVLALSLGGLPVFAGFWRKEVFLLATMETHNWWLIVIAVASSAFTMTYMLRFLFGVFVDGPEAPPSVECPPPALFVLPGLLGILSIVLGFFPSLVSNYLAEPATKSILGQNVPLKVTLHLDERLIPSIIALTLGAAVFFLHRKWRANNGSVLPEWSIDALYRSASDFVRSIGTRLLGLQNGSLVRYIRVMLTALIALLAVSFQPFFTRRFEWQQWDAPRQLITGYTDWALVAVLALIMFGTLATLILRRHLHIVLALGAVGYLIAGLFVLELAPDVSLVQVHVETLVTALFIMALAVIPAEMRRRFSRSEREKITVSSYAVAFVLAVAFGVISWMALEHPAANPIAPWFNENALPLAHAEDVVAAILVDFRALDTLVEISVFAAAAIGLFAVVRLAQREKV